jgi:hypothetical protein
VLHESNRDDRVDLDISHPVRLIELSIKN